MGHLLPHLLQHIFKIIAWADENLPDSKPLAWKLVFIGLAALAPLLALRYFPNLDDLAILPIFGFALIGTACLLIGGYIFFRRGIWRWQDRRSARIISIRWK